MSETKDETKTTPGPWVVGTGWIFGLILGKRVDTGLSFWENEVGCANATLAAAAPDLLEAAEAGEYLGDKLGAGVDLPPALIAEKLRVIRAALAKARGEAGR